MLKTTAVVALVAATMGIAGPALAVSGSGGEVDVNIEVHPIVSMWANHSSVALELTGANPENSDTFASSLSVINNVDANISASVAGDLPDDIGGANAINFFIFRGDEATAQSAIIANSNAPAGALVWNNDNLTSTQQLVANTSVNNNIANFPIVYGADAPNTLPGVEDWDLTVTYTITSN
jgi:hypothetical protein